MGKRASPLKHIVEKNDLSPVLLAKAAGVGTATVYNTINGSSIPYEKTAKRIVAGLKKMGVEKHGLKKIKYSLFIVWPHNGE